MPSGFCQALAQRSPCGPDGCVGTSTTEPVIMGLHTTVAFTEVVPATCRSYFTWKTKSLFPHTLRLFLNGHQARENDAGFASSCSTRSLHHQQRENSSLRESLQQALCYRGTSPIYTLSHPEEANTLNSSCLLAGESSQAARSHGSTGAAE